MILYKYARSASPRHVMLGVNEQSGRKRELDPSGDPQHNPLLFLRTRSGFDGKVELPPSALPVVFGMETFLAGTKYDCVDTIIARTVMAEGNQIQVVRTNNDPALRAGFTLYAVVETVAGQEITRVEGKDLTTPITTDVAKVTYVTTPFHEKKSIEMENMTSDGFISPTTKVYPVMSIRSTSSSEDYLNIGFTIDPIIGDIVNRKAIAGPGLSFALSMKERGETGTFTVPTLMSDTFAEFMLNDDAVDPVSKAPKALRDVLPMKWEQSTDPTLPVTYRELEDVTVHSDTVEELIKDLAAIEKQGRELLDVADEDMFNPEDLEQIWNMNPFTFRGIDGNKYLTINKDIVDVSSIVTSHAAMIVDMGVNTPIFLRCKPFEDDKFVFDALLTQEHHEAFIRDYMRRYDDDNHPVMDIAVNTETTFYDGQYEMETKIALSRAISLRKDTFVGFTTLVHSDIERGIEVSIGDQSARAAYLMTAIRLMPDSITFNTSAIRAFIVMGDGKMRNGQYREYKPQLISVVGKIAAYAGASNGALKKGKEFDSSPGNVINDMTDLRPKELGNGTKLKLYDNNLIWSQKANRIDFFFPQLQTVYNDDTAIVNNVEYLIIISTLTRYCNMAWVKFTGSLKSDAEIIEDIEAYVSRLAKGKFNGRARITPKAFMTSEDIASGVGVHLTIILEGYNSKTVLTSNIETRRWGDPSLVNNG